jgi:hypothetical protein
MKMFGLKPIEIILICAVGFLLWDKFKGKAVATVTNGTLAGASRNTMPAVIQNYSQVGDTFDLEVEAMTSQLGY